MSKRFIIMSLFLANALWATSPAKPGVVPSVQVIAMQTAMEQSYQQGGVVKRMAEFRGAGTNPDAIREDVYMSFPVIMGNYADALGPAWMAENLQQELFDGPWDTPTMAEHYAEMSYGQFHLSGQVYGWYQVSQDGAWYEGSQTPPYDNGFAGPPGGVADFLQETLTLSDPDIDFSQYDSDGPDGVPNSGDDDGVVDAAFFVHSGPGGEGGGPYIWSHRWSYSGMWGSAFVTNDSSANGGFIRVDDYIIQPANSTNGGLIEIGVFSHEFGHALGLPDLYDTDYSSDGIGDWGLMSGGSWNTPDNPAHMVAWCKEMLGWLTPVVIDSNYVNYPIPSIEDHPVALKIWTHGEVEPFVGYYSHGADVGMEYFLVENRHRLGTDIHLDNEGLLIWHIDNSQWGNSFDQHRMVDIRGADDYENIGHPSARDPYPGPTDSRFFDFETMPSAINWAGQNTEVALRNISDADTVMHADLEIYETVPHLSLANITISDLNGDEILQPGEAVEVWPEISNTGGPASSVTAELIADTDLLTVVNGTITFSDVGFMETILSDTPFDFTVADPVEAQYVTLAIQLSSPESAEADTFEFSFSVGVPDILVLDADGMAAGDSDYQGYYTDALDRLQRPFLLVDLSDNALPDSGELAMFSRIIWFSGDNPASLTTETMAALGTYLDNGGGLIATGQDLSSGGEDVDQFMATYFAAERLTEPENQVYVFGTPEHPLMEETDRFFVRSAFGAPNQDSPDKIHVLSHGLSLFMDPLDANAPMGTSVTTNGFRTLYLAFGFESLAPLDGAGEDVRAELLGRMLDWFDLPYVSVEGSGSPRLPRTSDIKLAYPNPFNPSIQLDIRIGTGSSGAELVIHDLRGREVFRKRILESGLEEWTPESNLAGGLYLAQLRVTGQPVGNLQKLLYLR